MFNNIDKEIVLDVRIICESVPNYSIDKSQTNNFVNVSFLKITTTYQCKENTSNHGKTLRQTCLNATNGDKLI